MPGFGLDSQRTTALVEEIKTKSNARNSVERVRLLGQLEYKSDEVDIKLQRMLYTVANAPQVNQMHDRASLGLE